MIDIDAIRAMAADPHYRGVMQHVRSWKALDVLCDAVLALIDVAQAAKAMREATVAYVIEAERDFPIFRAAAANAASVRENNAAAALDAALAVLEG